MKFGIDRADEEGMPCFLTASPMGAPVYRKLGFEDVGRLEFGMVDYGGEGSHVHRESTLPAL